MAGIESFGWGRPSGNDGAGAEMNELLQAAGLSSGSAMSAGDLRAYAVTKGAKGDYSFLNNMFSKFSSSDFSGFDINEMNKLFLEAKRNPEAIQNRMKQEFAMLTDGEKDRLLDSLASTGIASRAWWERFLKG